MPRLRTSFGLAAVIVPVLLGMFAIPVRAELLSRNTPPTFEIEAIVGQPDIVVTMTDTPDPVVNGGLIEYTITVQNNGTADASAVSLTDVIPAGTTPNTWLQVSGPPVTTGGGVGNFFANWTTFPAGSTAILQFVVQVNSNVANGTVISNTATATSGTPESTTTNNSATATTTVIVSADLLVTKTGSPNPVSAGSTITYLIVLANSGPSDALNAVLADVVPANTTFVSFTAPTGWTVTTPSAGGTGTITAANARLGISAAWSFTLVVQVNATVAGGTAITNVASVTSSTPDADSTNNTATATTLVAAGATVPTLSPWMLGMLAAALLAFAVMKLRA